jgi:glycosyltransferase involved in cell wall biosynthesis
VFSALHLSSSRGQRKGTTELTAAWHRCVEAGWLPPGARLHIILDGERAARCEERNGVVVTGRINASEEEMSVLYQRHHVVVQPSRAEGFGLVPLEALASGVPVVATSCTGHAEYVDAVRSAARDDLPRYSAVSPPGVVAVPTGELGPIDDGPGALAPSVDADAIAEALRLAYSDKDRLRREAAENARAIYLNWSWEATTRRFLEGFRRAVYRGSAGWT